MTYPITPAPGIHTLSPALQAQQNALTQEQVDALGKNLSQAIWNLILSLFSGGTLGTGSTDSAQAQETSAQMWTNFLSLLGISNPGTTLGSGFNQSQILQNWVNNVLAGLNLLVTTGSWNSLLTALFGENAVGSTIQVNAVPTGIPQANIQNLVNDLSNAITTGDWDPLLQALFGTNTVQSTIQVGAVPTGIPQGNIQNLVNDLSNAITTGDWNPLLTALFGGTTVQSTVQKSAVPNITAGSGNGESADLQTAIDGIVQGAGGTGTGHPPTAVNTSVASVASTASSAQSTANTAQSAASSAQSTASSAQSTASSAQSAASTANTNISNTWTNLFGSASLGTILQALAIPNITRQMSSDVQAIVDMIHQATNPGSMATGQPTSSVKTNLQQFPTQNIALAQSSGGVVTEGAAASNSTVNLGGATTVSTSVSITKAASDNYALATLVYQTFLSPGQFATSVSYGGAGMASLTGPIQIGSGGEPSYIEVFALEKPSPNAQTVTGILGTNFGYSANQNESLALEVTTFTGVGGITVSSTSGSGTALSMSVPSATNSMVYQAFGIVSTAANDSPEALSSYNHTQRYNLANFNETPTTGTVALVVGDSAGASSVSFSATASAAGPWQGVAVNMTPAPALLGSGAHITRVSTGSASAGSGGNLLASSFFDTQVSKTSDITVDLVNNKFTVSQTGWYEVEVGIKFATAYGSQAGALLYKGSGTGAASLFKVGQTAYNADNCAHTFLVPLSAGDYVQAGVYTGVGATITGDSSGAWSYMTIQLANRGLVS